ncbi:MAG TPA: TIGR03435 family protein [Vicinamibacterales bacterium]|nr:TIGR03435 family protein [Vicinamibacterales bacterium]
MRYALTFCLTAFVATLAAQQPPQPAFDVASLKRNTSLSDMGGGGPRPGGRYRLTNVTTRSMISLAWGIPSNRIAGGPAWIATDRYDLDATMKENATQDEMRSMMRALLSGRFRLAVHVEQRELPVYNLMRARPGEQLGPSLERSAFDCTNLAARKQEAAAASAARPGRMLCGFRDSGGALDGGGLTMETLAQILTGPAGRPVFDRTGLTGGYNVLLTWTPLATDTAPADAVSIFTAVQEQLGLKLESGTAPLDVLVIDRVERPSEN